MIKILHVSDIHLGLKASFLKSKSAAFRAQIVKTFEALGTQAIENKVNLLLVAGDLFDSPYPSRTNIELVKKWMKNLTDHGIYVVLLPGNHDRAIEGSVYMVENFTENNPKVFVFNDPKNESVFIDELDLRVYAKAITTQTTTSSPLPKLLRERIEGKEKDPLPSSDEKGEEPQQGAKYNIAVVHGGVDLMGKPTGGYLMKKEELENSGFDYIALGDWHSYLDLKLAKVKAYYCGSPEPLAIDQKEAGKAILVELEKGHPPKVAPLNVGKFRLCALDIEVPKANVNLVEIIEKSLTKFVEENKSSEKDMLVQIKLTGFLSGEANIDLEELDSYFSPKYFSFRLEDKSQLDLSEDWDKVYPNESIVGKYVAFMKDQMKDEKNRHLIEEAIKEGVRRLSK